MTTTTAAAAPYYTVVQVDPGTLILERNIRDAQPSPELVASVRSVGVLEPVTAVVDDDNRLVVRFGHRRVMAAVEAGVSPIAVYVAGDDSTEQADEVHRIISQRDENTHRVGLTAADEVAVVEQLAAFGMSASEISKQARVKKADVDVALTVSTSKLARKAAVKYSDLTLDQVAAVAEFEDDQETAKKLIVTAIERPAQFAHAAQRARDDRERAVARAAAIAKLQEAGVTVVEPPNYDSKTKRLSYLVDAKSGKDVTVKGHTRCPGHVAWVSHTDPDYGCTAPAKHGHRDRYSSGSDPRATAADMTAEEREKAKGDRRLVIENNKAWDSAQVVRRAWVADFAKRKTAPKGTAAFIAGALSADRFILTHEGNQTTRETLCADWGLPMVSYGYGKRVAVPAATTDGRALVIALIQVLAAHESSMDRMDWRRDGKTERHGRYLRFLAEAGYDLSDVEKYAISSKTVR